MMASEKKDVVILDGGLGILLLARGAFQSGDPLWSSRCLTSGPEGRNQLKQAHLDFLTAGADIIKTNSYQLSVGHLQECLPHLNQEECLDLIRDSVRVAREACQEYCLSSTIDKSGRKEPKVAGSIGPYGACLADMSEYTGAYVDSVSMEELIEWHRPRLLALLEAGVDYLALETFPALLEARAILKLLHDHAPNVPSWISFSCKEDGKLCHGEDFAAVADEIWKGKNPGLRAIGVNCSEEKNIPALLTSLVGRDIPVVIYPNSVDFKKNQDPLHLARLAEGWMAIYPHIWAVGGCCGYQPDDIVGLKTHFLKKN